MSYQQEIFDRDDGTCLFCGTNQNLHVHHIKFRSQGGGDELTNLCLLCVKCHRDRAHGVNASKYRDLFISLIKDKYEA